MKQYEHLFFDLDGTLWDLRRNTREALELVFKSYNGALDHVEFESFFKRFLYRNEEVWTLYRKGKIEKHVLRVIRFERAFADVGFVAGDELCEDFATRFLSICPRLPHLLEGTRQLLEHCHNRYQLHIITNGFREIQGLKLAAGNISDFFRFIINSEDCNARKPDPAIFEYAMSRSGANPRNSLMIGDDWEADILGARDFGMDQAYIMENHYETPGRYAERHNYTPTYSITSLKELETIL